LRFSLPIAVVVCRQLAPGEPDWLIEDGLLLQVAWTNFNEAGDVMNLGREAGINVPGRADGNWRWRCTEQMLTGPALEGLRELTAASNRSAESDSPITFATAVMQ
jgi:4-alpha-glucanotransferase